jgi:hypothetical protein
MYTEHIRTSAGVGSDTGTSLDVVAWLFCGLCASALAAGGFVIVNRLVGRLGVGLLSLIAALVLSSLVYNAFIIDWLHWSLGNFWIIAVALVLVFGAGLGALLTINRPIRIGGVFLLLIFTGCMLALWSIYGPLIRGFMAIYGNGPA